uniref:FLYWCH-type domain-containing protein n=1 Tax=Mesocestoides corti TaxID=53468 RepID=A0A5K3FL79_MESCO
MFRTFVKTNECIYEGTIAVEVHFDAYFKTTGSNYVMRNTVRLPHDLPNASKLVYRSIAFECYHFGTYTSYATIRRKQRTVKIGCRSKIYFCCKGDRLQVGSYQVKHNHQVSPESGAGELKVPFGKKRRKRSPRSGDKGGSKKSYLGQYNNEYDVITTHEYGKLDQHNPPEKDEHWVETPDGKPYAVSSIMAYPGTYPRRPSRAPPAVALSQLDFCLGNLKFIASSGGASWLLSCIQELMSLESKWRRNFGDLPSHANVGINSGVSDVHSHDVDNNLRERLCTFPLPGRTIMQDRLPKEAPQSLDADQTVVEYPNQHWIYD